MHDPTPKCRDCGKEMNPVDVLLGLGTGPEPICGDCVRRGHEEVTSGGARRERS